MAQHTVIIGGTSGIGLATAHRLAADGHTVTIAGRDQDRLDKALAELAGSPTAGTVTGQVADAADRAALDALFAATGPVDNLVLAAGTTAGRGALTELDMADFGYAVHNKLYAHFNAIRAALPVLAETGSVTLVTAVSAQAASPGAAGLAALNGALEAVTPTLALELAPRRVNAVSPGVIDTAWWDWAPAEVRGGAFDSFVAGTPVGRIGRPEDIADAITFLIGATFATGVVLPVDGGLRLKPAA